MGHGSGFSSCLYLLLANRPGVFHHGLTAGSGPSSGTVSVFLGETMSPLRSYCHSNTGDPLHVLWEVTASCRVSQAGPVQPLVWTKHVASRRDGQPRHLSRAPITSVPPSCPGVSSRESESENNGKKSETSRRGGQGSRSPSSTGKGHFVSLEMRPRETFVTSAFLSSLAVPAWPWFLAHTAL